MIEKGFSGAPFGLQSHRFDMSTVHPKNKVPGTFVSYGESDNHLGPGYYNYEDRSSSFCQSKLLQESDQSNWRKKYLCEKFSQLPYVLNKELYLDKIEQKRKLGPGYYSFDLSTLKENKMAKGIMSEREARFDESNKLELPGPGSYGKQGIPHLLKEEGDTLRKSASNIGFLNNGGDGERKFPANGSDLPPNIYNYTSFTDDIIQHRAGKRGFYDVFSLNRTKPIKTGHLSINPAHNLAPNHYKMKSSNDLMEERHKKYHGRLLQMKQYPDKPHDKGYWMSTSQMPPDPKNQICPATYFPTDADYGGEENLRHPFNCSSVRCDKRANAFFTGNFNPVGAGRYDVQLYNDIQHVNSHKNVFNSKTKSKMSILQKRILSERLKERNIPRHRRLFIDHVATEQAPCVDKSMMSSYQQEPLKLS